MRYRSFGRTGFSPSALGFGAMRLPMIAAGAEAAGTDAPAFGTIDVPLATAMLRRAVEAGITYVDTAYVYHEGQSEPWLGYALREVARDLFGAGDAGVAELRRRVKVATKLPQWKVEKRDDCRRFFEEQLERLRLDSVDFYLLHSLGDESLARVREHDMLGWAREELAAGRIGHLGFSFHGGLEAFRKVVDETELWDFCQIQYNFMDEDYQAGTAGLEYAAGKGMGVIVMEPLRGGQLARRPPEAVAALWAAADERREAQGLAPRTPVEWALDWVWDHEQVSFLLSGMSDLAQLEENLAYADRSGVGLLTAEEREVFGRVRDAYLALSPIPCTDCRYCLPCPSGVAIPDVFEIYNNAVMYGTGPEGARFAYGWLEESERAELCTECRACEELCPQQIAIVEWLERVQQYLAVGK